MLLCNKVVNLTWCIRNQGSWSRAHGIGHTWMWPLDSTGDIYENCPFQLCSVPGPVFLARQLSTRQKRPLGFSCVAFTVNVQLSNQNPLLRGTLVVRACPIPSATSALKSVKSLRDDKLLSLEHRIISSNTLAEGGRHPWLTVEKYDQPLWGEGNTRLGSLGTFSALVCGEDDGAPANRGFGPDLHELVLLLQEHHGETCHFSLVPRRKGGTVTAVAANLLSQAHPQ